MQDPRIHHRHYYYPCNFEPAPPSGLATIITCSRHPTLLACNSRAAFSLTAKPLNRANKSTICRSCHLCLIKSKTKRMPCGPASAPRAKRWPITSRLMLRPQGSSTTGPPLSPTPGQDTHHRSHQVNDHPSRSAAAAPVGGPDQRRAELTHPPGRWACLRQRSPCWQHLQALRQPEAPLCWPSR